MKLNIGAGPTEIEGFTPIDRCYGDEAWPVARNGVPIESNSVDEIRASHILEHFAFKDVPTVLRNWIDVLKPGGRIRVSVPDFDRILELRGKDDRHWYRYLFGGQVDENDFHKSMFTEEIFRHHLEGAGLVNVVPWESDNTDTAAHPCSVNYEGIKPDGWTNEPPQTAVDVKISAIMSLPRLGLNASRGRIEETLRPFHIPLRAFTGAFWGHQLQNALEDTINEVDWFLTFDYDTMCTPEMLSQLMVIFGQNPHIDALAAMQCRRHGDTPLLTIKGVKEVKTSAAPLKVDTAHFGMTLIRTDALRKIPLPWFWEIPRANGTWREDTEAPSGVPVDERLSKVVELYSDYFEAGKHHLDPDIFFWKRWAEAGNTLYVAPNVRIGHLEEIVAFHDADMKPVHMWAHKWLEKFKPPKQDTEDGKTDEVSKAEVR